MGQDERNRKFMLRGGQREHCIISKAAKSKAKQKR